MDPIRRMYQNRFSSREKAAKDAIWKVLCRDFFQRHIPPGDSVLDLGSGYCEFINHIQAREKFAVDLNPETCSFAGPGVRFFKTSGEKLGMFRKHSLDTVFSSNFFEHIPDKQRINLILREVFRVLRPGGKFLLLQPNIKYLYDSYWDFYDHYTPLSHLSLSEALACQGFEIRECVPRFLPYMTKSSLPQSPIWVAAYLKLPFLWRFFGKQMFIVAIKPGEATPADERPIR